MSVCSANEISPTRRRQCRHVYMPFLNHLMRIEILRSGIFPTRSPPLCYRDFYLSELPFDTLLMRFSPLGSQTLAYGFPSSEPMDRCIHPSIYIPHMGFFSLGRQLRCGISPIWRKTLMLGLLPFGGTRSSLWVGALSKNAANLSLSCTPTSGHSYASPDEDITACV